jgi:hypothetical protein
LEPAWSSTQGLESVVKKMKLNVEELAVESFGIDVEKEVGTVLAAEAPTKRTFECPCYESISCFC